MASSALAPVSEAVFTLLQDSALSAALPGGVYDTVPQGAVFPCAGFTVQQRDERGFGTGHLPNVELRTRVYSALGGMREAQIADGLIQGLLKDTTALSVSGFTVCGRPFYRETVTLDDSELNGVPVHEIVSIYNIFVES